MNSLTKFGTLAISRTREKCENVEEARIWKGSPAPPKQQNKQKKHHTLWTARAHTPAIPMMGFCKTRPITCKQIPSSCCVIWEMKRNKASNITFTTVPNSNTYCCVRLRPLCGLPLRWGWCQLYWGYQEPWQSYLRSPRTPHSVELLWRSLPAEHTQWCFT